MPSSARRPRVGRFPRRAPAARRQVSAKPPSRALPGRAPAPTPHSGVTLRTSAPGGAAAGRRGLRGEHRRRSQARMCTPRASVTTPMATAARNSARPRPRRRARLPGARGLVAELVRSGLRPSGCGARRSGRCWIHVRTGSFGSASHLRHRRPRGDRAGREPRRGVLGRGSDRVPRPGGSARRGRPLGRSRVGEVAWGPGTLLRGHVVGGHRPIGIGPPLAEPGGDGVRVRSGWCHGLRLRSGR